MMNTKPMLITSLTGALVPSNSFSALRLPARTMLFACTSVYILWIINSSAMLVSTFAGAIFSCAFFAFQPTCWKSKFFITCNTGKFCYFMGSAFNSFILALWRTIFSSSMFYSGFPSLERFTASRTYNCYHNVNYSIKHGTVKQ